MVSGHVDFLGWYQSTLRGGRKNVQFGPSKLNIVVLKPQSTGLTIESFLRKLA